MTLRAQVEAALSKMDRAALTRAVDAELCRRSFSAFVRRVRPEYEIQPYQQRLIDEIQEWATAEVPYPLVLSLPPGHGKSEYAKLAVAWVAVRDPSARHAYASYGSDLAEGHVADLCSVLESEAVQDLYGRLIPAQGSPGRTLQEVDVGASAGGTIKAVGRGGPLTGKRLDTVVIDDLIKDDVEAQSPTTRESSWRWVTRVALTRKRADRSLRLLVLATRWHLDDPTSRVLALLPRAKEVRFSALKVGEPTADDPREEGEALWSAVATAEQLAELRAVDPLGFAALYQQHPVPDGGSTILATHLARRWSHLTPLLHQPGRWVQSWDCRNDGKDLRRGSQVAAHLYFEPAHEPATSYLVDKRGGPWTPDETLAQFDALQGDPLWGRAAVRLIEAKADGKMLLSLRQRQYSGMTPITPTDDKVTRTRAVVPLLAAGQLVLPEEAPWLGQVVADLVTFPAGSHDDDVDALTQYLSWRYLAPVDKHAPPPNPLDRLRARQGIR